MAKLSIKAGSTDVTVYFRVFAYTASNIPQPKTGLVYSGFTAYYCRQRTAATAITTATQSATGAHSDGGLIQVDATNMPGVYRFDLPDAVCATGSPFGIVTLRHSTTTNSAIDLEIELTGWDNQDGVRGGMTALPNVAAEGAGGLFTRGTGAGQIQQSANGRIDVNVENWNATAVPAEHTAGYPIVTVKDGTGTGEINTNAGGIATVDSVTAIAANGITAASIATGAIDADALAADAIDEIWDEAMTELSAVPGVTASLRDALRWLFALSRNKLTQTSTATTLRNDADSATIGASTVSDNGTTFTRGEFA